MNNIFIVNYNSAKQLLSSLNTFFNSIDCLSINIENIRIFILNNSNTNNEKNILDNLPKKFSKYFIIYILHSKYNFGYAGGHNFLLNKFKYLFSNECLLFIVNPDVVFTYDNIISIKNIFNNNNTIGQVMSKTLNEKGGTLYSSIKLYGFFSKSIHFNCRNDTIVNTDYCAGSFFAVRFSIINRLTYIFDKSFFMYWEDVDLSHRIQNLNYSTVSCLSYPIVRFANSNTRSNNMIYYSSKNCHKIYKAYKNSHNYTCFQLLLYKLYLYTLYLKTNLFKPFNVYFFKMLYITFFKLK